MRFHSNLARARESPCSSPTEPGRCHVHEAARNHMAHTRYGPEGIASTLRQVEVLTDQGMAGTGTSRHMDGEPCCAIGPRDKGERTDARPLAQEVWSAGATSSNPSTRPSNENQSLRCAVWDRMLDTSILSEAAKDEGCQDTIRWMLYRPVRASPSEPCLPSGV